MIPVGMGVGWIAYSLGLWGYCLVRGYNVTLGQLMNPFSPYKWESPMPQIPVGSIFPSQAGVGVGTVGPAKTSTTTPAAVTTRPPRRI